jgi:pimeloyl-ACP methyl ester carboxylesterase
VRALLLPGIVLPAESAYARLAEALGDEVEARPKDLEVYRTPKPPPGYSLALEIDGALRAADEAGWERFHLVGYSGGGAVGAALAAAQPERLLSLALLEPAWTGWTGLSPTETAAREEFDDIGKLEPDELMATFARLQLRPGVEPPPPPDGPPPPWMAQRPTGIAAFTAALRAADLPPEALRRFDRPVYHALGGRSRRELYGEQADRLARLFPDFTAEVFEQRHHFDPPHRVEPERLAASLLALWRRAEAR